MENPIVETHKGIYRYVEKKRFFPSFGCKKFDKNFLHGVRGAPFQKNYIIQSVHLFVGLLFLVGQVENTHSLMA
jgi:hypothetical protein